MTIKVGTGSGAVEPTQLRLSGVSGPVNRVMVGTGNDAVPAYAREVPPLEPLTVGSATKTWTDPVNFGESGQIATFQVTGGGKARFRVNLNGPGLQHHSGSLTRTLTIFHPGGVYAVKSWHGPSQPDSTWLIYDDLTDEITVPENATFTVVLTVRADLPSDRYINSWSVELLPTQAEGPVDPDDIVEITGTSGLASQTQFRNELAARGLDYRTLRYVPFVLDTSQATELQGLFQHCAELTTTPELDTSNVTNMNSMFAFNPSLTTVPEMDTSKVTNMNYMFATCRALTYVPDMDTANVEFMVSMFNGCLSLTDGNVRLIGKHPRVNTNLMIEWSGLTREPFVIPAVETTTVLTVIPSEITEGGQALLVATVTPSEAVGEVTFTVDTQTSTVALVDGVAESTVTLDTPGEYEVTAEFVPVSEDDFTTSSGSVNLTVLEFVPAVETSTALVVEPEEVEEGESVTVTATVSPTEAVGSVVFDVAGQTFIVQVEDGMATTTATLDEAGEFDITADFVPDSDLDFLPSSATGSVTVIEGGPVELVPMSWSGGSSGNPGRNVEKELVSYTVVGSGPARVSMSFSSFNSVSQTRNIYLYVNNIEVFWDRAIDRGNVEQDEKWEGELNDGDVLSFRVMFPSAITTINSWSVDLTPIFPYDVTIDVGSGSVQRFIADGDVASHVVQDYEGPVVLTMTTVWRRVTTSNYIHRMYQNGTQLIHDSQSGRNINNQTSVTEFVTHVVPGDILTFASSSTNNNASDRDYDSMVITIATP